jgi:hypothetical protein
VRISWGPDTDQIQFFNSIRNLLEAAKKLV